MLPNVKINLNFGTRENGRLGKKDRKTEIQTHWETMYSDKKWR